MPFLPHGLGNTLGLQVHDVAGFMQDDRGTSLAPPSRYPHLRCTRVLQPRMMLTIEPGLYLSKRCWHSWRSNPSFSRHLNWSRIESFKPYGGIRIEDNIVIRDKHI